MTTFKKIITLNNEYLEDGIMVAEITKTQYELLKKAQKEILDSYVINETTFGSEIISVDGVYERDGAEKITIENIDALCDYVGIDGIEIDFSYSNLHIKFANKHMSGYLNADEAIEVRELDVFFFEDALSKAQAITIDDSPMLTCWDCSTPSGGNLISTCWDDKATVYVSINNYEITEINKVDGVYVLSTASDIYEIRLMSVEDIEDSNVTEDDNEHYCNICCMETIFDEAENCEACGNNQSLDMSEKDEEIQNLAYENKMMAEAMVKMGLTQEQVDSICSGDLSQVSKPSHIFVTEDDVKAHVIESYTCNADEGAKDYDRFMESPEASGLVIWEPFENHPNEWLRGQMQRDVKSTLTWLSYFGVSKHEKNSDVPKDIE